MLTQSQVPETINDDEYLGFFYAVNRGYLNWITTADCMRISGSIKRTITGNSSSVDMFWLVPKEKPVNGVDFLFDIFDEAKRLRLMQVADRAIGAGIDREIAQIRYGGR